MDTRDAVWFGVMIVVNLAWFLAFAYAMTENTRFWG